MTLRQRDLHVLIVDDSAVVRRFLSTVLTQDKGLTVETASDPFIGMRKMAQRRPDVMILDIEMPRMDGFTFLRKIMAEDPIPVVICSGHAGRGTGTAIRALSQGAVDIVAKPSHGVREFLQESAVMLLDTVRAAAEAKVYRRTLSVKIQPQALGPPALQKRQAGPRVPKLVAIGASTGGPQALHEVLGALPPEIPGIVIVQHMPEAFTGAFARHLDEVAQLEIKEAEEGDRVLPGRALVAPGNRHVVVVEQPGGLAVRLLDGPIVSRHRPSVDVLFRSAAQAAGADSVGVILTGMGDDGVRGLLEMCRAGATTLAQAEKSCVVFGMPKEAIAVGAAKEAVPLASMASRILELCQGHGQREAVRGRSSR